MSGRRVLVVDDEPDMLLLVELILTGHGWHVDTESTIDGAITALERDHLDVVLLDLRMPGIGGWGLIRQLEEEGRLRQLPVVVLSAHASDDTMAAALAMGCRGYVRKPFTNEELRAAVDAASGHTDD